MKEAPSEADMQIIVFGESVCDPTKKIVRSPCLLFLSIKHNLFDDISDSTV